MAEAVYDGCYIGTGIPMLAASLAQKMHAPNIVPIFEFGDTGAQSVRLLRAVGESRNELPTAEELQLLREEIDPEGFYI